MMNMTLSFSDHSLLIPDAGAKLHILHLEPEIKEQDPDRFISLLRQF